MNIMMYFHAGSYNRGCEAIVRSSTKIIKERLNGSKVFLSSGRPDSDRIITNLDGIFDGAEMPIKKYSPDWFVSSLRVKFFKDEGYALSKIHQKVITQAKDMDICLSIGGDNYCYGEQPGWYEVNKRVKQKNKKIVLWGCSIGPEDLSERKLVDLKRFDLILARETLTYSLLKEKGLTNVRLVADPAFTLEKEELPLLSGWQEGNTIGLNFSPLVLKKNMASQKAVRDLINHILDTTDSTIAFTPHVIDEGNNDYELLEQFYNEFKSTDRVLLLPQNLNATQYKGYIARMRFFIGARTHATIAAYSNFVPTMVLGYSIKSKGIAKDLFGEEKLVLGLKEISNSKLLIEKFNEMISEEEALKQKLKDVLPSIQERSYQAVDYLNGLVK
jgi:colanic acid/amylovoran biosynthesis protein